MKRKEEKMPKEKDRRFSSVEERTFKTVDEYQCCGSLETDFAEVCRLLGMTEVPLLIARQAAVLPSVEYSPGEGSPVNSNHDVLTTSWCPKHRIQVELQTKDPQSVREVKVSGWKIDEQVLEALNRTLPAQNNLQTLYLWRTGLTEETLTSLKMTVSLCVNLRTVILEGNPLPEHAYSILIADDNPFTHLSLRNNWIGETGASFIGAALSTKHTANKSLLSLNLAFNSIGDAGAKHIAQGLRLNRTLLYLSLACNRIGDAGAADLAEVLGPFALTHEEVVERRRLLSLRFSLPSKSQVRDSRNDQSLLSASSNSLEHNVSKHTSVTVKKMDMPKNEEKQSSAKGAASRKEETKSTKKGSDIKVTPGKGIKSGSKEKHVSVCEEESPESPEVLSPLLETVVQHRDGKVFLPGNNILTSLNLSGNKLTEESVRIFLSTVSHQPEGGGLLRLSLYRNCFQEDSDTFLKLQEIFTVRDPLNKSVPEKIEDEPV